MLPPDDVDVSSPQATAAYWAQVEAAAKRREVGPATATLLLHYALGGCLGEADFGQHPAPPSTVAALLASGVDLARDEYEFGGTPLHLAATVQDGPVAAGLCRVLLDAGAPVNAGAVGTSFVHPESGLEVLPQGRTPLHRVATTEAARVLLAGGADATACTAENETMLWSPAARRDGDLCRTLIALGADPSR
jgi:hypothetical protein